MTLAFHPYANLFPFIEHAELLELAEDIRANGLQEQIMLIRVGADWQILDGRNRYRALAWLVSTGEVLGDPWGWDGEALSADDLVDHENSTFFKHFEPEYDGEPLAYVLSKNLRRRHLDESQRAMVAARLANLAHGGDRKSDQAANLPLESPALPQARAAEMLNVSERTVRDAKTVQREAAPEIAEAVDRGQLAVSAAAEIAAQPADRQAAIVASLPRDENGKLTADVKKALAPVIKELRKEKVDAKKARREEREEKLGRKIQALPEQKFGVAIEDFEWDHEAWSRETGLERHPSMHYETAADAHSPEEIVARCAERFSCLAEDCVLFKWTTIPHLAIALKVLELQGFECVTHLIWNKERPGNARGPGYWFTGEHEVVLVGARGKVVAPAIAHFRSNFSAPVGEHSEKPDRIHEIVEYHWPNTPKVEFNARRTRPGWFAWGFDAPAASPQGDVGIAAGATPSSSPARLDRSAPESCPSCSDESDCAGVDICRAVEEVYAIADGGSDTLADRPALDGDIASPEPGEVHSVAEVGPADVRADAVPPAIGPGLEIPREEASGTAREAPSTVSGREPAKPLVGAAGLDVGTQSAPPRSAVAISEYDALKALSDFCHPRRSEICAAVASDYAARGFAILQSASGEWILRDAGWARLRELEALRNPAKPAPADDDLEIPAFLRRAPPAPKLKQVEMDLTRRDRAAPEIVDGALQTRLPLTEDEIELHAALADVAAGKTVDWQVLRQLVGAEFVHATATRLIVTEQGRAFLAQLVPSADRHHGAAA